MPRNRLNSSDALAGVHSDLALKPCDRSIIDACVGEKSVEVRFLSICHDSLRLTGVELEVPSELDKDLLLWRRLVVRVKAGDFRYSDAELRALKEIAYFTLQENARLRNQPTPGAVIGRTL